MTEADHARPPTNLGTPTAIFVVISSIVGVGILTTSGTMSAALGSNGLMVAVWVVGGLVALCGALSLAEAASAWPGAGGEYPILLEAYGPFVAYLYGWATLLVGFAAPISASAYTSAIYLVSPWGLAPQTEHAACKILATAVILLFTAIHARGHRATGKAQGLATVVAIVVLVGFVAAGLVVGRRNWANLVDLPAMDRSNWGLAAYSLVYVAYGYNGWNSAAYLAGEVRDPGRTLPRAIVGGTLGIVGLYVGINVVYSLGLPAAELSAMSKVEGPDAVVPIAKLAARRLFGDEVGAGFSIAVGLILIAMVSAYILTGPRVMFAMARLGQLPAFLGKLSPAGTPARASAAMGAGSLLFLYSGTFDQFVVYAGVGLTLMSILSAAAVFVLRVKHPDRPRPFRVPGYPVVPAIYLAGSTALVVGVTIEQPFATLTSILAMLAVAPFYRRSKPGRGAPES